MFFEIKSGRETPGERYICFQKSKVVGTSHNSQYLLGSIIQKTEEEGQTEKTK